MRTSIGLDHARLDGVKRWPGRSRGSFPPNDHPGGGNLEPWHPYAEKRNYNLHKRSVERVIGAMGARLDDALGNKEMAEIACFSPYHFNRIFRQITGIPPTQFLYALRLETAKRLLVTTDLSVTEICFEVGYNSLGTFISRFNELVGLSPNAFRRFAGEFESFRMEMIRDAFAILGTEAGNGRPIEGTVTTPDGFDGLIFLGLFRRAIPERQPISCALRSTAGRFALTTPDRGRHFVFSVGVPWSTGTRDLLTLDGLPRGRSAELFVERRQTRGLATLRLTRTDIVHPPILAALPLLVARHLAGVPEPLPAGCAELLEHVVGFVEA